VILCSGRSLPYDLVEQAKAIDARCTSIDMVGLKAYAGMPIFETERFECATDGSYGDLSLKRNLGLLIGRMAGWKTVLFLDDDIAGLSVNKVRRVVSALEHCAVAGMPATDFPDNSVVCHARRRFTSGETQDVFVSGSALAVDVERANSFFPSVYNEDWMFLAPHLDRRSVTSGYHSEQKPYYPFDSTDRAVRQEFGDVLAEGLVGHLHTGNLEELPTRKYWASFLARRADIIADGVDGCYANKHNPMARDAIKALEGAERKRSMIETTALMQYLVAWKADLLMWKKHIDGVTSVGRLGKALAELGLQGSALTNDRTSRRQKAKGVQLLDVTVRKVSSSG
jgi:hypothetical protein